MTALAILAELEELDRFLTASAARQQYGDHVCMAAQPETVNGSPEVLVDEGVEAGAIIAGGWAERIVAGLEGKGTELEIRAAIQHAGAALDLEAFAREAEQTILRGLMLGALDSVWERENDEEVAPAKFAATTPDRQFVYAPFTEAVKQFEQRQVLPPAAFRALEAGAKRRAFTVAGLAKQELLDATHAELLRQLQDSRHQDTRGANLRDFQRFAKERLESAGWTPANPSHVETVFRTTAVSAYSSGRVVEMTQPKVLALLPYWQIRTVKDARQRPTHHAADGVCLPADHPFWRHAYPPFGYNCRCRVCARTRAWLERNPGVPTTPPPNLPDPGFDSGTSQLISVPPSTLQPAAQPAAPPPRAQPVPPRAPPTQLPLPLEPPAVPLPTAPVRAPTVEDFGEAGFEITGYPAYEKLSTRFFGRVLNPDEVKSLISPETFDAGHRLKGVTLTAHAGSEQISLWGRIVDAEGKGVATISREYTPMKGGVRVHHAFLKVAPEHRASGIGSRILVNQLEQYERLNVKKIDIEAAWDGQYVWARAGFDTAPATLKKLKGELKAAFPHLPAEAIDALPRARDLAMLEVDGVPVGKNFLRDRGNADGDLIPMSARVDPADAKYQQIKDYFRSKATPKARDAVAEHFAKAAEAVEAERKLQAARAAESLAADARRAARPERFHAALELKGTGVANGAEARLLLRDMIRETVPTLREGAALGDLAVLDVESLAVRPSEAIFEPDSGRIVYNPDILARGRAAMQRLSAGPIGELTPAVRHELDGLRTMVHEELHSLSGNKLTDITPHSVVLEEIGTELSARRVMRDLVPQLRLSDGHAYAEQISAIRYRVQKLKGIKADDALDLMAKAHERAALRTAHATGEAGVQAWLEELGLTAEQKGQMLTELAKVQARMFGGT